ncbi:GGDEF domain-containing protein [Citromicrobium bathyomarinum]|uniref:GGDEF domain-containing protein n=1 Tax=Sphingomonadales TaxID=204457 RepID=UPI000C63731A|nr:GGDEF domain-containing protein [Citromicrobium sp.]MBO80299.1 GGDEF domain-containing protein [Citromicrobium sp.]|tara:strand:+ start:56528 stop:57682 length:1155 start_codon:yes stop_codon:yes gene_type:complete
MATIAADGSGEYGQGILHRIGIRGAGLRSPIEEDNTASTVSSRSLTRARRRQLKQIRAFMQSHDLDVTPLTLRIAYEACSGTNPGLVRSIDDRRARGLPITLEWLEAATGGDASDGGQAVSKLADRLEHGIDELSRATSTVRRVTSQYGDELERQVDDLAGTQGTEEVIAGLADFAKAMLARSRQTEEELRASERETALLRENLDRARRDAEVDYLTGLPNRRAFEKVLQESYEKALAEGQPLSVAFCDLDHFKAINDTHGHEAGDRILKVVAETLTSACRGDCFIARHGGEEFVMLCRGVTPAEAFARIEAAREELAQRRMINRRTDKPFGIVTFSAGIADVARYTDPREALAAADEALYQAKEGGRNQIRLAGDPGGSQQAS